MNTIRLRLLVMVVGAGLCFSCLPAAGASVEGSDLLPLLASTPASVLVSQHPAETRNLTLDLIFYRWACAKYEADPGIANIDRIASSLAAASTDPVVARAVADLGPKEWTVKAIPAGAENEQVRALGDARQALDAAVSRSNTYPTRSIESLTSCVTIVNGLDLKLSWAFVTERLAERQLYAVCRYREARANYERVCPIFSAYGLREKVARASDDLGCLETKMNRYFNAYQNYVASANEWTALGRGDLAGKQLVNAGMALAADGKPSTALLSMARGLELCRAYAGAKKSYTTLVQLLLQVAPFHGSAGDRQSQEDLLREAESRAGDANDPLLLASVLKDEAAMWQAAGMEPRARGCLFKRETLLGSLAQKAAEAASKLVDLSLPSAEQSALLSAAEKGATACDLLGRYRESADILDQLIPVCQALKREEDEIRFLRGLARDHEALGNRQEALNTRITAAQIAYSISRHVLAVEILREVEQTALDARDTGTAVEALREAVAVIEVSGNRLALADILESRGLLLERIGELDGAVRDLRKSADIYVAELGEPWTPARVLASLAAARLKNGKPLDAVASLYAAVQRIEQWADDEGVDADAEAGHSDTLFKLYSSLLELEIRQGLKAEAVAHLTKARDYTWCDRLRSNLAASAGGAAADVIKATEGSASPPVRTPTPGEVRKVAGAWHAVLTQARPFSRVARGGVDSGAVGPIDAGEIYRARDRLPQGLAVVEYAVSDSSIYALVATAQSAVCWELPVSREKVSAAVSALRTVLRETEGKLVSGIPAAPVKSWSSPELSGIMTPLSELGQMLFEPIRGDLPPSKIKTLAFALPDELAGIPFHAIPRDTKGAFRFVIQDYAVTYIPLGMFKEIIDSHHGSLNPKICRVGVFYDSSGGLPGALRERNLIKSIYTKSISYTGAFASAERFVSTASSSNIVHIAAHHEADPNPSKFSIVLSGQPGGKGTVLFTDMLRIKNPNLELAVLSACDTMSSSDTQPFAAAYTAEVFSIAGFPSVIGGLWKVSDDASVTLMGSFYRRLSSLGKAESLRRAQVSMIQSSDGRYANPFYWASFALYGDPR